MRRQAASVHYLLLALLAGTAAAAEAPPAPRPPAVTVRDGTITATLEHAPVAAVVAAIAEQTGAEVKGEVAPPRDVTLELHAVPFEEAFERLLGTQSFTLTYDSDGRLKRVALAGDAGAPAEKAERGAAGAPAAPTDAATEATRRVAEFVQGDPTMPVGGRLARALGTDTATFQQVLGAALRNDDPRVRAAARRSLMKTLTGDPEVHEALVTSVDGMSDDSLVRGLRAVGGNDAEALATAVGRYGRSPVLARRMQRAISRLRAPGDS